MDVWGRRRRAQVLKHIGIKSLYGLALAEGEGVGTAYEYYVKRLTLAPLLRRLRRARQILVAGLPQKYGSSLDFLQLAAELGGQVTIVDERASALDEALRALKRAQADGWMIDVNPGYLLVSDLATLSGVGEAYDLSLSSEVLQRIPADRRSTFVNALMKRAASMALFVPNADNPAHTEHSGLEGIALPALQSLVQGASGAVSPERSDVATRLIYLDLPPFPPGIVRTEEQRLRASSGLMEAAAMRCLGYYARFEKLIPFGLRRRHSHIVCATVG